MSRAHEEGAAGNRRADRAVVDQLARGLVAAAEKGVRRAADPQVLLRSDVQHLSRLRDVDAERLFGMDMLAGVEHCEADVSVSQRHREVDHDLDVVALEELVDPHRRQTELGTAALRRIAAHVGERADIEDRKALRSFQIRGADVAATDYSDADFSHSFSPWMPSGHG
jgi:hypothetical protein